MCKFYQRILIASHVLDTLPDQLSARRALLEAVVALLPLNHELRTRTAILTTQLNDHEKSLRDLQRELPLLFSQKHHHPEGGSK